MSREVRLLKALPRFGPQLKLLCAALAEAKLTSTWYGFVQVFGRRDDGLTTR